MEERCFETEYILTTDNDGDEHDDDDDDDDDGDEHDDDDGDGILMNVRIMMMKVATVMAESCFETEYKPPNNDIDREHTTQLR